MINLLIIMKCLDIPFNDNAQYMSGKNVKTLPNINIYIRVIKLKNVICILLIFYRDDSYERNDYGRSQRNGFGHDLGKQYISWSV